jgi:ribosomal protein L33
MSLAMDLSNRLTKLEKMNISNYCPEIRDVNCINVCPVCGKHHE